MIFSSEATRWIQIALVTIGNGCLVGAFFALFSTPWWELITPLLLTTGLALKIWVAGWYFWGQFRAHRRRGNAKPELTEAL